MTLNSEAPLPCPFCGGGAEVEWMGSRPMLFVVCKSCGNRSFAVVASHGGTEAEAIAAWNRRPALPSGDELDEQVRQLRGFTQAYAEDIFSAVTPQERKWLHDTRPGLQGRIAADMGRHLAKFMDEAATRIQSLMAEVERQGNVISEMEYSDGDAAHWRHLAEAAEARVKVLEEVLEPFARVGDIFELRAGNRPNADDDPVTEWEDHRVGARRLTVGDFRRARSALNALGRTGE